MDFESLDQLYARLAPELQEQGQEGIGTRPLSWFRFPDEQSTLPEAISDEPISHFLFSSIGLLKSVRGLDEPCCYEICRLFERAVWHIGAWDPSLLAGNAAESFVVRLRAFYDECRKGLLLESACDGLLSRTLGDLVVEGKSCKQLEDLRDRPIRQIICLSTEELDSRLAITIDKFAFYKICELLAHIAQELEQRRHDPSTTGAKGLDAISRYEEARRQCIAMKEDAVRDVPLRHYMAGNEERDTSLVEAVLSMRARDVVRTGPNEWLLRRGVNHEGLAMLSELIERACGDDQAGTQPQAAGEDEATSSPTRDSGAIRYGELQESLLSGSFEAEIAHSLSYWLNGSDHHMPGDLLEKTVRDVLSHTYDQLLGLPGVGRGKIRKVCTVLQRIMTTEPSASSREVPPEAVMTAQGPDSDVTLEEFAAAPTEGTWQTLCEAILSSDLRREKLGRFVETLRELPSTVWEVPLEKLARMRLAELRSSKSWGERRISTALKVFWQLGRALASATCPHHLSVSVQPGFIVPVEIWIHGILNDDRLPDVEEILREFIEPILAQVARDGSPRLADAARLRLGINGAVHTLDDMGEALQKSKERVRQYLTKIAVIMKVRWPEGQYLVDDLCDTIESRDNAEWQRELALSAFGLFYPVKKEGGIVALQRLAKAIQNVPDVRPEDREADVASPRSGQGGSPLSANDDENGGPPDVYIHSAITELLKEEMAMDQPEQGSTGREVTEGMGG